MNKLAWLLAPCAVFMLAACDASETTAPVVATPERTIVLDPDAQQAAPVKPQMDLTPDPPVSVAEQAEAVQRNEDTKARIEQLRERMGRPERRRLRDRD